ncbi:MAG: DNA-formamidopyrimidine glycosylase [Bdellovibrionota bacterium]|jgi:formamidopyrimidine-DNA glycosylase
MPELPEVESTVRRLRPDVVGQKVRAVTVYWDNTIACPALKTFKTKLKGREITALTRRGKYLVFELDKNGWLLFHLRMSGKLAVLPKGAGIIKHTRLVVSFESSRQLRFDDVRKFGRCYYVEDLASVLGDLGVEPLAAHFSPKILGEICKREMPIKTLLLDQHSIAGIGNIYADEALWRAKIHPLRKAKTLTKNEVKLLHRSIQRVLKEAISAEGTDFGDNVVVGDYTPQIYGRSGLPCSRCKTLIQRLVVGQRGTHFCPCCQKLP